MSIPVIKFVAPIVDEHGGRFNEAIVYPIKVKCNALTCLDAELENGEGDYIVSNEVEAITYSVQYYYSAQTLADGFRSRTLREEVSGAYTNVFNVDVGDAEVLAILGSLQRHEEKLLNAVKADIIRRFS